ncbi:CobW family GTP-binding protein [Halorientalis regularis]|uniref:GTPase, G3E family n=1 Tax=Halorientalis regularis TaxID=660518 RepID=A0A1G7RXE7_9EURY|nr:GTP-binding protein [Halorientalis regularis]SDG15422.1 GTPase, G3E family [Halorientalis regularis]
MSASDIPVSILSGGLGAGKTTTLNHLLENAPEEREIAVLVNDMGEVNVDAALVERQVTLDDDETTVTELSNGCICCGLANEFGQTIVELAKTVEFDALVVEPSGMSDPAEVAQTVRSNRQAAFHYNLDTIVTVVDAALFHDVFIAGAEVNEVTEDAKPLSDLLAEQVEFCDLVLLNKTDLVTDEELAEVESLIRALQPQADIETAERGRVDPCVLLDVGRFDLDRVSGGAGWKQAHKYHQEATDDEDGEGHDSDDHDHEDSHDNEGHSHEGHDHDDHLHPPEEFGLTSCNYGRPRPFHPERLVDWLADVPADVVRAKGLMWVAGRERHALNCNLAGTQVQVDVNGQWAATMPEFQRKAYREARPDLDWDEEWGDREIDLVFIGHDLDETAIQNSLDDCLLTDVEMDEDWERYENPFPGRAEEELVFDADVDKWGVATV